MDKVEFKDLSGALKTAVVLSFVVGGVFVFEFLIGFFIGLLGR